MTNLYDDITPKPRKSRYIGPGEGRKVQTRSKPKPKAQRNESFDIDALGGTKPKVVAKPKPRKAKVQNGGYDPLAGPKAPMSKSQLDSLNTFLAKEYERLGITQNPYKTTPKKNNTKKK